MPGIDPARAVPGQGVQHQTPHSVNTFLVDGQVAGTWRFTGDRVDVEPFEPLSTDVRREVADEADRLAAFHA